MVNGESLSPDDEQKSGQREFASNRHQKAADLVNRSALAFWFSGWCNMEGMVGTKQEFGQKELIARLLDLYNKVQAYQYTITRWPDEEERTRRACDAFAESAGANPLAIEHTKIETFISRKLDDARFLKIFGSLEAELKSTFPCCVELWIPTFALQRGVDWNTIRSSVKAWLLMNVRTIAEGRGKYVIPNVPFPLTVEKHLDMPSNFLVGRFVPPGKDDQTELVDKFSSALTDKNAQLAEYRRRGAGTILLAESDDIALVSPVTLYKAFLCAQSKVSFPNIDQVWMAHAYAPENWCEIVCFLGPDDIMDNVNPANYEYGPRYREAWISAMREEGFAGMS